MAEIALDEVTKVYGDGTQAISDLTLDLADAEFMVFVGPSGCGKTTALRMVAGGCGSPRSKGRASTSGCVSMTCGGQRSHS
jgi:ABC-type Fe3+/spermidine/putrescine transport system ATPase subunit